MLILLFVIRIFFCLQQCCSNIAFKRITASAGSHLFAMEQDCKKLLLNSVLAVRELIDSSSSDSDDEEFKIIRRNPRRKVPRIENYVEDVISASTKEEFKAHFRYIYHNLLMFKIFYRIKLYRRSCFVSLCMSLL